MEYLKVFTSINHKTTPASSDLATSQIAHFHPKSAFFLLCSLKLRTSSIKSELDVYPIFRCDIDGLEGLSGLVGLAEFVEKCGEEIVVSNFLCLTAFILENSCFIIMTQH